MHKILSSTDNFLNIDGSCAKYPIPFLERLYIGSLVISSSLRSTCP